MQWQQLESFGRHICYIIISSQCRGGYIISSLNIEVHIVCSEEKEQDTIKSSFIPRLSFGDSDGEVGLASQQHSAPRQMESKYVPTPGVIAVTCLVMRVRTGEVAQMIYVQVLQIALMPYIQQDSLVEGLV